MAVGSKLSLDAKVTLVFLIFLLPIAVQTLFYIRTTERQIAFSALEIEGLDYLRPVWQIASELGRSTVDEGNLSDPFAVAALRKAVNAFGEPMRTGEASDAVLKAVDAPQGLTSDELPLLLALVARIGDGSNLILDPDLDSYYLMDLTVQRLPAVLAAGERLMREGRNAARNSPAPHGDEEFLMQLGRFSAALETAIGAAESSFRGNADGSVKGAIDAPLSAFYQSAEPMKQRLRDQIGAGGAGPALWLASSVQWRAFVKATDGLWQSAVVELARLLRARVDGLIRERAIVLTITGLSTFIALLVAMSLRRSIRRDARAANSPG